MVWELRRRFTAIQKGIQERSRRAVARVAADVSWSSGRHDLQFYFLPGRHNQEPHANRGRQQDDRRKERFWSGESGVVEGAWA